MSEETTPQNPTAEQVEAHVTAMGHSADLINAEVAKEWSTERGALVERNVEHLELMLSKPFIVSYSGDKSSFVSAVAAGKAYVDANKQVA